MSIERTFDPDTGSVGETVLEAVAALEGTAPTELPYPLHSSVDPDALEALVSHRGTTARVTFRYAGYRVTVESEGRVSVTEAIEE